MREINTILFLFLLINHNSLVAQDIDTTDVEYFPATDNYFEGYEKAKLKADYYFTDGWSYGDRYWYEVVIVDNKVMLHFHSDGSDSFEKVFFEKKRTLEKSKMEILKKIILAANLKQIKNGIPRASFSAFTKEVLVVKYNAVDIAGGMVYGNTAGYSDSEPENQVRQEIENDRRGSSSIGGDYDKLIKFIKSLFPELPKLMKKMDGK